MLIWAQETFKHYLIQFDIDSFGITIHVNLKKSKKQTKKNLINK